MVWLAPSCICPGRPLWGTRFARWQMIRAKMSAHYFRSTVGMVSSGEYFPGIDFSRMGTSSVVTGLSSDNVSPKCFLSDFIGDGSWLTSLCVWFQVGYFICEEFGENDWKWFIAGGCDDWIWCCPGSSWIVDQRCFEFSEDFTLSAEGFLQESIMSLFVARQCFRYSS